MKSRMQDIPVPEELNQVVESNLNHIYAEEKRRKFKKRIIGWGTAAAILVGGVCIFASNPALAENLPIIRTIVNYVPEVETIFSKIQDSFVIPGDYSDIGEPLEDPQVVQVLMENTLSIEEIEAMEEISEYTQVADGISITLSEWYCNSQSLYITILVKTEEPMPMNTSLYASLDEAYSFNPYVQKEGIFIEGAWQDEYTYAGMLYIDLSTKRLDLSAYQEAREAALAAGEEMELRVDDEITAQYGKIVDVTEEFSVDLSIWRLMGNAMVNDKDESLIDCDGPWTFSLDVKQNCSETQTVEVNDVNELGIGIEKVVKDRYEIVVYDILEDRENDYVTIMFDANGEWINLGQGSLNTSGIGHYDVSCVDVYIFDYIKWFDELKPLYWNNRGVEIFEDYGGKTFKEILMDECSYHTVVEFEEE